MSVNFSDLYESRPENTSIIIDTMRKEQLALWCAKVIKVVAQALFSAIQALLLLFIIMEEGKTEQRILKTVGICLMKSCVSRLTWEKVLTFIALFTICNLF